MSGIATAIIGGAVIGAVASNMAADKSSSAITGAANTAAGVQYAALAQQKQLAQPYLDLSTSTIPTYQKLLTGDPATQQKTLESLPGYQFTRDQGIEAAKRASGAGGLNLTGNQVGAVETYGAGLADQTFGEQLNRLLAPIQLGQAAAAGQASNIQTGASNIGNIAMNTGNAIAGIDANLIAGESRALTGGVNQYLTYRTLQGLNTPGSTYPGTSQFTDPSQAAGSGINPYTGAAVPPTYSADTAVG